MDEKGKEQFAEIKRLSSEAGNFTVSLHIDRRLYKQDIAGSIAHARMLSKQEIISPEEGKKIIKGLKDIQCEIENDEFPWNSELEDIHMNIENRLREKIGSVAGKLHTARSRNDQVGLDLRMYIKEAVGICLSKIRNLQVALVEQADQNQTLIMPGYTHLQKAQPVLYSHHMMAYFEMFDRDVERFEQVYRRVDVMPLGSGALAGSPYPVDREYVASQLGFASITNNSMDAISDRDFVLDYLSAASICVMHISRLAEELILWTTDEFGVVRLSDIFTTGSSMMPQKRNPDFAEIARAKTGRIYGNLMGLLTVMKALPMTYNRDLQEDKESFFDTHDTIVTVLDVFARMIDGMEPDGTRMKASSEDGMLLATDIADYLVRKAIPFREAYSIVSRLSEYAYERSKRFDQLSIDEFTRFSDTFEQDVFEITVESSVAERDVYGGTSPGRVRDAITDAKRKLDLDV